MLAAIKHVADNKTILFLPHRTAQRRIVHTGWRFNTVQLLQREILDFFSLVLWTPDIDRKVFVSHIAARVTSCQ